MSDFFIGRRNAGNFVLSLADNKARLECTIWQTWQPIIHSVIWCGRKQTFTITRRIGVSQAEKQSVEGAIEGSLGITAIASIKSSVKGVLEQEVTWEAEVSESQNFEFEAPKCGRLTALIMQLVRNYDLRYEDTRWLHRDSWSATITEHTIYLYDDSKPMLWDKRCGCEGPDPGDYNGLLEMSIGAVSALVPYRAVAAEQFELQIGDRSVAVNVDPSRGLRAAIRSEWLPSYLPFLIGERAESFDATFTPVEPEREHHIQFVNTVQEIGIMHPYLER